MRVLFQIFIGMGIFLVCGCKVSQFGTLEKVENSNSIWMMAYMPGASFYIPPNSSYCFDGVTYWSGENGKTLHHCAGYEVKVKSSALSSEHRYVSSQRSLAEMAKTWSEEEREYFKLMYFFSSVELDSIRFNTSKVQKQE